MLLLFYKIEVINTVLCNTMYNHVLSRLTLKTANSDDNANGRILRRMSAIVSDISCCFYRTYYYFVFYRLRRTVRARWTLVSSIHTTRRRSRRLSSTCVRSATSTNCHLANTSSFRPRFNRTRRAITCWECSANAKTTKSSRSTHCPAAPEYRTCSIVSLIRWPVLTAKSACNIWSSYIYIGSKHLFVIERQGYKLNFFGTFTKPTSLFRFVHCRELDEETGVTEPQVSHYAFNIYTPLFVK